MHKSFRVTTVVKPLLTIGTRIIAYQTAYDALGPECDPSYTLQGGNPGRMLGPPAPNGCASIGTGNSLAPLPTP